MVCERVRVRGSERARGREGEREREREREREKEIEIDRDRERERERERQRYRLQLSFNLISRRQPAGKKSAKRWACCPFFSEELVRQGETATQKCRLPPTPERCAGRVLGSPLACLGCWAPSGPSAVAENVLAKHAKLGQLNEGQAPQERVR